MVERVTKPHLNINSFNKEDDMTTENQTINSLTPIEETTTTTFSKAASLGRNTTAKATEATSTTLKTLSLRPTKSVKKNSSFKPLKKVR